MNAPHDALILRQDRFAETIRRAAAAFCGKLGDRAISPTSDLLVVNEKFAVRSIRLENCAKRLATSIASGTISSPAALGVGARKSATKSAIVKSISCPTAETTGISEAAIARAKISSLNSHRSSALPPPRQTTITSTRGKCCNLDSTPHRRRDLLRRASSLHAHGTDHHTHPWRASCK